MEKETCNKFYRGMVITGVIGAVALWINSSSRQRIVEQVKEVKDSTIHGVSFIRENRKELVGYAKLAAKDLSGLMKEVNKDLKEISESASHLKESSAEFVRSSREMASRLKKIKEIEEK